jgi:hypothetical protein
MGCNGTSSHRSPQVSTGPRSDMVGTSTIFQTTNQNYTYQENKQGGSRYRLIPIDSIANLCEFQHSHTFESAKKREATLWYELTVDSWSSQNTGIPHKFFLPLTERNETNDVNNKAKLRIIYLRTQSIKEAIIIFTSHYFFFTRISMP